MLGSGTGGKILAGTFAQKGQRVIAIERKYVTGSCPNIACLPSKNIIHSAKVASFFYRSNEFGISKENVRINMAAVRERKRKMEVHVVDIFRDHYFTKSGAELVMGTGRFVGPKTIEVALNDGGTRTLRGKIVAINTGSRATEVTLLDRNGRLAHSEDEDTSQALEELCRDEGITVVANAKITRVEGNSGDCIRLLRSREGADLSLEGTHLLVAAGRTPNTSRTPIHAKSRSAS